MAITNIEPWETKNIEKVLRDLNETNQWKVKQWIHPLRIFTTGTAAGPPLFDTLKLIGKERVTERIKNILKKHGGTHASKQ